MNDDEHKPGYTVPTPDTLFASLFERARAGFDTASTTSRLALAEARLAASSAGLLLLVVLVLAAALIIIWLLCMALLALALHATGLAMPWVLVILLTAHLLLVAVLVWIGSRLVRHLAFRHTRQALAPLRNPHDPQV